MDYLHPFRRGERISQRYGTNPGWVLNGVQVNPAGGHTGNDYAVFTGTPVHAAADGIIDAARTFPTYNNEWLYGPMGGKTIVLNTGDNGPSFGYSHLSHYLVAEGDHVTKGQVIGLSGNSGSASTGAHCHVETLPPRWNTYNGTYGRVDPALYFTQYIDEIEEDDMAELSHITPDAMENLRVMVADAVRAELAPIIKALTDTQNSVGFQEKFSVQKLENIETAVTK